MDSIEWLQRWYLQQCNEDWEHWHGITIQTLDNPGWLVTIELTGTRLQDESMVTVGGEAGINHSGLEGPHDWIHCRVRANKFEGAGGPNCLLSICEAFRSWVESLASVEKS